MQRLQGRELEKQSGGSKKFKCLLQKLKDTGWFIAVDCRHQKKRLVLEVDRENSTQS